ncbi:MAG: ABC transporter permease [Calditrichaeota bacterium]|nr:ABC transporter permease [Calditrichota bacterium]
MLFSLAWKNIWRNKKRSLIIIAAIGLGLWGSLFAGAVWMGWGESMVDSAIERNLAHIQIHQADYLQDKVITNFIPDGFRVLRNSRQIPGVQAVSGRTLIEAMAASPVSTFGVKLVGIVPDQARQVTDIYKRLISGNYFESAALNPVVIGKKLADRLNLKVKSKLVLSFQGLDGTLNYVGCRIIGIYKTESSFFDESHVFMKQSDLFRLLNTSPILHEIAIRTANSQIVPEVYKRVKARFPDLSVKTWKELAPEIAITSAAMESFTYMFIIIILFALLFGITNTMLMAVIERFRELGVLIAVGMKQGRVFTMILLETVMLSLTGGMVGFLLGAGTIAYTTQKGIDFSAFASGLASFGASTIVHPVLPLGMYIALPVMIVVTACISAVLPAWKAIHIQPAEAVRTY